MTDIIVVGVRCMRGLGYRKIRRKPISYREYTLFGFFVEFTAVGHHPQFQRSTVYNEISFLRIQLQAATEPFVYSTEGRVNARRRGRDASDTDACESLACMHYARAHALL